MYFEEMKVKPIKRQSKVSIEIDFGQENSYWGNKDAIVKDETGKRVIFNSMIDVLNFMSKNDYIFVQAYTITVNNKNVYHYLMKKKKLKKYDTLKREKINIFSFR